MLIPIIFPFPTRFQKRLGSGRGEAWPPLSGAQIIALEAVMVGMVNAERRWRGLRPLANHAALANVARAHSEEMRDRRYFSHYSPNRSLRQPVDRCRGACDDALPYVAENISLVRGRTQIDKEAVQSSHEGLMNSPGHRENILRKEMTHIGIGMAVRDHHSLWVTQMFLLPEAEKALRKRTRW